MAAAGGAAGQGPPDAAPAALDAAGQAPPAAAGQAPPDAAAAAPDAAGQAPEPAGNGAANDPHQPVIIPVGQVGNNPVNLIGLGAQDAHDVAPVVQLPMPPVQAQRRYQFPDFFRHPLSKQATIAFLKQSADASVMGLVTLSAFFATYLLAWGPAGSTCIPPKPEVKNVEPSWLQLWAQPLVAALPFLVFPLTLFVSGLVQAVEQDGHALGFVAAMCLTEFIVAFGIGAGMMFCMSGWSQIWYVACPIIALMVVTVWGFTFMYPACLRKFVWSTCCRQDEIVAPVVNQ